MYKQQNKKHAKNTHITRTLYTPYTLSTHTENCYDFQRILIN